MFLDDGQELERHAAGFLGACLPFFDGGFAGIEIAGEDWLAYMLALANFLDLTRFYRSGNNETGLVEATHCCLVDRTGAIHALNGAVDRFRDFTSVLAFICHHI